MGLVNDSIDVLVEVLRVLNSLCVGMGLMIGARTTKVLAACPVCAHNTSPRSVQLGDGKEHCKWRRSLSTWVAPSLKAAIWTTRLIAESARPLALSTACTECVVQKEPESKDKAVSI